MFANLDTGVRMAEEQQVMQNMSCFRVSIPRYSFRLNLSMWSVKEAFELARCLVAEGRSSSRFY